MSLKSRLSRLSASKPPSAAPPSFGVPVGADGATDPKVQTIEELRLRMNEILKRPVAEPQAPASPSETLLPFLPAPRGTGRLHRRCLKLARSKTIGRIPVDAAGAASAGLLSLLALDPSLVACDPARALYLDTETTGLGGGAGTIAFLIGMAWFEADELWLEQLLLTSPVDEPALLESLDERLAQASMLITFNGKSFDWPLLAGRYVMNQRPRPLGLPHLDLLHIARRLHKDRLGAVNLKRLESEVLGLERGPDVDGAEIGPRYAHFLRTGDESALCIVVEHNATDVLSMAALVGLYGEPIELLVPEDLVGLGRTLSRAGQAERALAVAQRAWDSGAGPRALQLMARLNKARGDRSRALLQFEAVANEIDDPGVRLELAKLYEHLVKDHESALAMVQRGTSESAQKSQHRRSRLEQKLAQKREKDGK